MRADPKRFLSEARVVVSPETLTLVSVPLEVWKRLLENPEISPRVTADFMILKDKYEVTMLLETADYDTMRHALRDAKVERGYRMLTFDIELDLGVIGFLLEISHILATAGVPILAVSSFSRDHILVRQADLALALKSLGPHVADLC